MNLTPAFVPKNFVIKAPSVVVVYSEKIPKPLKSGVWIMYNIVVPDNPELLMIVGDL